MNCQICETGEATQQVMDAPAKLAPGVTPEDLSVCAGCASFFHNDGYEVAPL